MAGEGWPPNLSSNSCRFLNKYRFFIDATYMFARKTR